MSKFIKELFKEVVVFITFIIPTLIICFGILFSILYPINKYTCNSKGKMYNVETSFSIVGCFVKNEESHVPMKIYEESTLKATNVRLIDGE